MNRRIVAAGLAIGFAVVGVLALLSYVGGVNERAYGDAKLTSVLQVVEPVAAGTPSSELSGKVQVVKVPATVVAKSAIANLSEINGMKAMVTLEPGEQLLSSRFSKAGNVAKKSRSAVPAGMQEVTLALSMPAAIAADIKPGDRVGVVASVPSTTGEKTFLTGFVSDQTLVTRVDEPKGEAGNDPEQTRLMVTFAANAAEAKRLIAVGSKESNAVVWLTKQNDKTTKDNGSKVATQNVLK